MTGNTPESVLDTCVLIGVVSEVDQHHTTCVEYIRDNDYAFWVTKCAKDEFDQLIKTIREELEDEISEHRQDLIRNVAEGTLDRSDLNHIQNSLLPDNPANCRAFSFLHEYYDWLQNDRVEIDRLEIELFLEDLEIEVYEDASNQELGGWKSHIDIWTKGCDEYPDVESNLLICEGDDPQICIEAHHLSLERSVSEMHLATANTAHFIDNVNQEPESREDNITRVTAIDEVDDVSYPLFPNQGRSSHRFPR